MKGHYCSFLCLVLLVQRSTLEFGILWSVVLQCITISTVIVKEAFSDYVAVRETTQNLSKSHLQ